MDGRVGRAFACRSDFGRGLAGRGTQVVYDRDGAALPVGSRLGAYEVIAPLGRVDPFVCAYWVRDLGTGAVLEMREFFPEEFLTRDGLQLIARSGDAQITVGWGLLEFVNEAQVLARVRHPALPKVYGAFEGNGTAYYVREGFDGQTFADWLNQRTDAVDGRTLMRLLRPLCEGLAVAHDEGFLHRGIRPERIGLRPDGTPLLLDCGAGANALRFKSRHTDAIIAAGYAPLEDYAPTARQGPWGDVYALAALYYEALCGERPPPAPERARGVTLEPLSQRAPQVAVSLANAVDWGLTLQPSKRPRTIREWMAGLEGGLSLTATGSWVLPTGNTDPTATIPASVRAAARSASARTVEAPSGESAAAGSARGAQGFAIAVALGVVAVSVTAIVLSGRGDDSRETAQAAPVVETMPVAEPVARAAVAAPSPTRVAAGSKAATIAAPTTAGATAPLEWSGFEQTARSLLEAREQDQARAAAAAAEAAASEARAQASENAAQVASLTAPSLPAPPNAPAGAGQPENEAEPTAADDAADVAEATRREAERLAALREEVERMQRKRDAAAREAERVAAERQAQEKSEREASEKELLARAADARKRCRIAAADLSVNGRLNYDNALSVAGARQAGNSIRLPEVQVNGGRWVTFEILPNDCAREVR